jgi:hypothetical protein
VHQGQVESVPVIDPLVRRVRVAHHHDRMRLVLDLKTAQPPAYVLEHRDGTITLELGTARTTKASAPSER